MPDAPHPPAGTASGARSATTSAWSWASWGCFGLAVLAASGIVLYGLIFLAAAGDPRGGPLVAVPMLVGMGAAWWAALVCALVGSVCGLLGVVLPARRTPSAWAALALNGSVVAISAVLLLILSP
jgi:hypothetical protein